MNTQKHILDKIYKRLIDLRKGKSRKSSNPDKAVYYTARRVDADLSDLTSTASRRRVFESITSNSRLPVCTHGLRKNPFSCSKSTDANQPSFCRSYLKEQRGATMVDLLLMLGLVAIVLPFIFDFQKTRIDRAKNLAAAKEMEAIQVALERYIDFHKKELLSPVGKNITRVRISDLEEYGAPSDSIEKHGENFQVRILKSQNREGHSTLQGIVVLNDQDITPLRTREIINLGNGQMGFVEQGQAFGAFGTWHANTSDLGIASSGGIIETTKPTLDQDEYLWRIPSENSSDATMLSPLNLGGHDIINANFLDANSLQFEEILTAGEIVTDKTIFQTRTTLDKSFQTSDATVAGTLSADSRNMEITGTLTLADVGKFTSFTADEL
ncbi:MAG: type II secretion system GspH family protein, partial [Rickettsiales bacterium]|nr:type II secretion system GspH family protein [Rickettsiales bacterium]